jgi:antitoxin MazE
MRMPAVKLIVREVDGLLGITFSKELAERLQVRDGDELYAVETDRGLLLTSEDPVFEGAMQRYRRGAEKYRNALRELAD